MAGKSTEEYWNTSSSVSFNFDDDSLDFNRTSPGLHDFFESGSADPVFGSGLDDSENPATLPIHSIITKRNLDSVLDDVKLPSQAYVPPVQETIMKMFLGMPFTLHVYCSLDQKLELLDEAVAIEDGNIILAVLLYLKNSIKLPVLYHHLLKRKIALEHYTNYLMRELRLEELSDLYMAIGNLNDIVYLFCIGNKDSNKEQIYNKLVRFLAEHQSKLNYEKNLYFTEYRNFTKRQVENYMTADSVIEQLAQICRVGWMKSPENSRLDKEIVDYKQLLRVRDFQYEWIVLNTLGVLKLWKKVSALFIKPNWLTKKNSIKSVINPELFLTTLYKHDPPKQVLEEFLSCIVDSEINLALAKKMHCHKFVIDAYINQRDRLAIISYKECIPSQSEELFYAENALRASDKKWKN